MGGVRGGREEGTGGEVGGKRGEEEAEGEGGRWGEVGGGENSLCGENESCTHYPDKRFTLLQPRREQSGGPEQRGGPGDASIAPHLGLQSIPSQDRFSFLPGGGPGTGGDSGEDARTIKEETEDEVARASAREVADIQMPQRGTNAAAGVVPPQIHSPLSAMSAGEQLSADRPMRPSPSMRPTVLSGSDELRDVGFIRGETRRELCTLVWGI